MSVFAADCVSVCHFICICVLDGVYAMRCVQVNIKQLDSKHRTLQEDIVSQRMLWLQRTEQTGMVLLNIIYYRSFQDGQY